MSTPPLPPRGVSQAAIRERAQRISEARGATVVEDRDLQQAVAELQWASDVVDESSAESFPASDPPAWAGHPHPAPDEKPPS